MPAPATSTSRRSTWEYGFCDLLYKLRAILLLVAICVADTASSAKPPSVPDGVDYQILPAKISQTIIDKGLGTWRYRGGVMWWANPYPAFYRQ